MAVGGTCIPRSYQHDSISCYSLQEYLEFRKERSKMLLSRRNQLLLEFSFWNEPLPRAGPNIYELRTYKLKVNHSLFCFPSSWTKIGVLLHLPKILALLLLKVSALHRPGLTILWRMWDLFLGRTREALVPDLQPLNSHRKF